MISFKVYVYGMTSQVTADSPVAQPRRAYRRAQKSSRPNMSQIPVQPSAITAAYPAAPAQVRPARRTTGYVFDINMTYHANQIDDEEHPEDPQRILRIHEALRLAGCLDKCERIPSRHVTKEEVLLVHSEDYWKKMKSTLGRAVVQAVSQISSE